MAKLTQEQYDTLKEKGLSETRIAELAQSKGYELPSKTSGIGGVAVGLAKGVGGLVRDVAGIGNALQRGVAGITRGAGLNVSPLAAGEESPFSSASPAGQSLDATLTPNGAAEKTGKIAVDIANFFIPGAKTTQIAGRVTKGAGELVSKAGIGISAKEAPLIQMYRAQTSLYERMANLLKGKAPVGKPVTNRETALNKNIFGTESMIGVQATRGASRLWKEVIEPPLNASGIKVGMKQFIDEIGKEVEQVAELSRRGSLQKALQAFADDYKSVGEVSLAQLQKLKEGWAAFLPDKAFRGEPISAAFKEIQNIAAQIARNKIYKGLGNDVKAAYFDYGNLKNLQALGEKALTESKLKGGAGSFIHGVKDMVLTPIASTGGLVLYKTGKGLEFVGTAGLKKVRDIFGF